MKKLKFKKIDAFASYSSSGNPAAVIYLDSMEDLSEMEMLTIAKELKGFVSEVGYVCLGTDTDYRLRYFSSEREVAFCGHATIAILNDIIANTESLKSQKTLSIATQSERLMVENRYIDNETVYISAPFPKYSDIGTQLPDIASAMNSDISSFDEPTPVKVIDAGLETVIVPMSGLEKILSLSPDLNSLNEFCVQIGVDIVIVYSSEVATEGSSYRTRVFAPTFGYLEDPATGSGNSAFGYYLLNQGLWDGSAIKIEQNGNFHSPNYVHLFSKTADDVAAQVWFGGGAVLKIDGYYILN